MKRLILILLTAAMVLSLASCAVSDTETGEDKLKIVTTIFPQYDFARAVSAGAPESVEITMLLPPGSESHDYEPTVADLVLIEECDLFICVGGETDAWVDDALEAVGKTEGVLRLIDMVPLLHEDTSLVIEDSHAGHDHHDDEDCDEANDDHGEYDEHVWTSPRNAAIITDVICKAMCEAEPSLADEFKKSAGEYISKLNALWDSFIELSLNRERDTVIFAERFPFR